jgi:hypothetical protein
MSAARAGLLWCRRDGTAGEPEAQHRPHRRIAGRIGQTFGRSWQLRSRNGWRRSADKQAVSNGATSGGFPPRPSGYTEVYSYSRARPCLFPQHGPGKKHLRPIILLDWQEEMIGRAPFVFLRGLIHSDGSRFINTGNAWRHPRYSFSNLSEDIRLIFTSVCDQVGLRWTTSGPNVYITRKMDEERMDRFIGPKS